MPGYRENAAKDALISWAYRYISKNGAIRRTEESVFYGSAELEFFEAAKKIIPNIEALADGVHAHADLAVKHALERQ